MADIETNWTWNFAGLVSSSKAQSRPSLPKETAWDLIGFDGNHVGGLRPHPGFVRVDSFSVTGTLVNCFPVNPLRSATAFSYGYVLVIENGGNTEFVFRGWNGSSIAEISLRTITGAVGLEVDVQVLGRYIFVFARGYDPSLHILNASGAFSLDVDAEPAGPGSRPTVLAIAASSSVSGIPPEVSPAFPTPQTADLVVRAYNAGSTTSPSTNPDGTSNANRLTRGRYGFAIQYINTATGRKTPISENGEVFIHETSTLNLDSARGMLQYSVRNKVGYDRALVYRTVNQGSTGGGASGAPMHLEVTVTIDGLNNTATYEGFASNQDRVLVYKDVYVERGNLEATMPKGGIAQFLEGTLFVSRISGAPALPTGTTPLSPPAGLGELRWSSLLEILPENFSPFSRWVPQTPSNEIIGLRKVGSMMLGFSQDRLYHIRRQGAFARIEEMHPGFGLAARWGIESVGNLIYFVSNRGLKAVSAEGQVDDVLGLNNLLQNTWISTISSVQLAYDANTMCLYTYRPTQTETGATGHAALMWFSTSRMTELVDLPFKFLRAGNWVSSTGALERRALFFKPQGPLSGTQNWGVFVPATGTDEVTRNKSLMGDSAIIRYWDTGSWGGTTFDPSGSTPSEANYYGCAGYVVQGDSTVVAPFTLGQRVLLSSMGSPDSRGLIACAPVFMRWTGSNVGTEFQPGAGEFKDFFRNKQVSSMAAYVEYNSASNPPTADPGESASANPFWMAEVYRGSRPIGPLAPGLVANQPLAGPAVPLTPLTSVGGGQVPAVCFGTSITDPEDVPNASFGKHGVVSSTLSPSWVCFWPGADITLLALTLKGRILDSDRRYV